ncbi:unnamed protein product, partial [Ectocarpus sp. 13 AM-2016]
AVRRVPLARGGPGMGAAPSFGQCLVRLAQGGEGGGGRRAAEHGEALPPCAHPDAGRTAHPAGEDGEIVEGLGRGGASRGGGRAAAVREALPRGPDGGESSRESPPAAALEGLEPLG